MSYKIIDVSGYGHSGKGVLTDFFKEFKAVTVHDSLFEFNLLRIQGGLVDLKHNIVDNWSPIRSDAAIKRFRKLVVRLGTKTDIFKPKTLLLSSGDNYDRYFSDKFLEISNAYIENLISANMQKFWPYVKVDQSNMDIFLSRLKTNICGKNARGSTVFVTNNNFMNLTRDYLDAILSEYGDSKNGTIVTNNMIEPYNPIYSLGLFNDARSIIVRRDPRDIYASLFVDSESRFTPEHEKFDRRWQEKKSFLAADDIDMFIRQQRTLFDNTVTINDNDRVLRLRFEDVVLNYKRTKDKILAFTDISVDSHIFPQKYFDPNKSAANVGLWKHMNKDSNIIRITNELQELCFNE